MPATRPKPLSQAAARPDSATGEPGLVESADRPGPTAVSTGVPPGARRPGRVSAGAERGLRPRRAPSHQAGETDKRAGGRRGKLLGR
jgi:hypothetical protein